MAWVRFPDGSRRKVERVEKADAQRDLDELVGLRAQSEDPGPRRERLQSFAEVIEAWFEAGCPNVSPTSKSRHARTKSPNAIADARQLLGASVLPVIGKLRVDRTPHRAPRRDVLGDGLLPERRSKKDRKSFTIEEAQRLLVEAIPADPRPAMWLTGLTVSLADSPPMPPVPPENRPSRMTGQPSASPAKLTISPGRTTSAPPVSTSGA